MSKFKQPASTDLSRTIGNNLRKLRIAHHMSRDDLGKKLNISYQQVQKYESGVNRIPIESLTVLKELFHVPFEFFIQEEHNQLPENYIVSSYISDKLNHIQDHVMRQKIIKVVDILSS